MTARRYVCGAHVDHSSGSNSTKCYTEENRGETKRKPETRNAWVKKVRRTPTIPPQFCCQWTRSGCTSIQAVVFCIRIHWYPKYRSTVQLDYGYVLFLLVCRGSTRGFSLLVFCSGTLMPKLKLLGLLLLLRRTGTPAALPIRSAMGYTHILRGPSFQNSLLLLKSIWCVCIFRFLTSIFTQFLFLLS